MKNFLFNDIVTQQKIRKLVRKIIYELLDIGKENALSTEYLKQALGFRNVRSLRKQVERERLNGKIIISFIFVFPVESSGIFVRTDR